MFEHPNFFFLFFTIPFIIALFVFDILIFKKRAKLIAGKNVPIIIPYYSEGQKWLRLIFYTLAFCLAIFAVARPRWGVKSIDAQVKGRDILVLLDVSYSMAAKDIFPSRHDSAVRSISELLELETGDRIGLMVFSGESELVVPVTHDYGAVNFFLDSLYPGMLGKSGTNIGDAILNAITAFEGEEASHKMVLLLTDGENLQGDLTDVFKKVSETNIKIFTAGVGTKNGDPIPILDQKGEIDSFAKDNDNNIVLSKLDEKQLLTIATEAGGKYLGTVTKKGALKKAVQYIKSVEKKEHEKIQYEQKKDRYDIFLIPALILLCLGFILDQGKIMKIKTKKFDWLFNKNFTLLIVFLCLLLIKTPLYSQNPDTTGDQAQPKSVEHVKSKAKWAKPNGGFWGNRSFNKEQYKKALEQYVSALQVLKDNELSKLQYNIGNVYYKLNDLKNAERYYEQAAAHAQSDDLKAKIFYNQGLAAFKNKQYDIAAELFKNSLKYNDADDDARYNYVVSNELKKMMEQKQQQQQNDNKNKQDKQDKQEQKKEQQKQQEQNKSMSKEDIEKLLKALDEKEKKDNKENTQEQQKNIQLKEKYW